MKQLRNLGAFMQSPAGNHCSLWHRRHQQLPDLYTVSIGQSFQRGNSQLLFKATFHGLIIFVGNASSLGKFLLCQTMNFPQLFKPLNQLFLCL